MPQVANRRELKRMCFSITKDEYFYLKEKALELQKQNQSASVAFIIRDLIEKDMEKWIKKTRSKNS